MSNLNGVAQRTSRDLTGQQGQKGLEVGELEFLGRQELPIDRTQLSLEFGEAAIEKSRDGAARFGKHRAVHGEARRLQ